MPRREFKEVFPDASRDAIDLLEKMLVLDPDHRISVVDALCHPYLSEYSSPDDEPIATESLLVDAEEDSASTLDDWRELIWKEIATFRLSPRRLSCFADSGAEDDYGDAHMDEAEEDTTL